MISSKVALSHWSIAGVPKLQQGGVVSRKAQLVPSWQFSGSSLFPSAGASPSCWWSIQGHMSMLFTLTAHVVYKLWNVCCFKCCLPKVEFTCTVLTLLPDELALNPTWGRVWSHRLLWLWDSSVTLALRGDAGWLTQMVIHGVEALEISPAFLQMLSSSQQPPGSSNKPRSYFNLLVLTIPFLSRNSWPKRLKQPFTQQDHREAKIVKGIWFPLRKQLGRAICLKHSPTMAHTPPALLHGEWEADK